MCVLCRDVTKKPTQLGHIIPHSVLKEAGRDMFFDFTRGTEAGVSRMGFRAFCGDCEKTFQQGEVHFNPKFFSKLHKHPEQKLKETVRLPDNKFPWLYYCLISIIWRSLCFVPENSKFLEVLECLRDYLLNWQTLKVNAKVKLFLFAPDDEIDQKLGNDKIKGRFFYDMFHFLILGKPNEIDLNFLCGWLFCGPLHVCMIYSKDNFSSVNSEWEMFIEEWEVMNQLTSETKTFTIGNKKSRFFPVVLYEQIVQLGKDRLSSAARLPSVGKVAKGSSSCLEGTKLHLLPKNVSYNRGSNDFEFDSGFFKERTDIDVSPYSFVKIVRVKQGSQKIIFVAVKGALRNEGEVAMGLNGNADGTVQYMKGVNIPPPHVVHGVDLNKPPYKENIEELVSHFKI